MMMSNESKFETSFLDFDQKCKNFCDNLMRLGVISKFRIVGESQFNTGDPSIFLDFSNSTLKKSFRKILEDNEWGNLMSPIHPSYGRTLPLTLRDYSSNDLTLSDTAKETLLTTEGQEKLYHDIEQGIKPAIINRFEEKIETLSKDECLFDYEREDIRDNFIRLLRHAIETIESLASSEGIVAVSDSVDELYDLRHKTDQSQISTAIASLETKISEMDDHSVKLKEGYDRRNASFLTTSAQGIFNQSTSAAEVRETLTERARNNPGGASDLTV